jgi:signal transduction histidine kinase
LEQVDQLLSAFFDRYRYSALGSVVKGIVHNLNGSLQVLSMQMELLDGMLAKEVYQTNPSIHTKMAKCQGHIDQLKGMLEILIQKGSHDDHDSPQTIRLNDLLEEEISLLKNDLFFKHQVKVRKDFHSKLPDIKGYYIDFSEGLLHLIKNAIEAMEGTPKKELMVMTETRDGGVQVTIKDTGCGVSEEIRPHLFKPFFTTKGEKHYGLGLFLARKLLDPYGASFNYTSGDGETIFSVDFPLQKTLWRGHLKRAK